MLTTFNKTLLSFTCLLVSVAALISCNKDDNNNGSSDKTELLSFGPTGARHGDTLKFIGHGLDKVTSIKFTGNNAVVDKATFKLQTSEMIRLIVPQAAERGYVTLKTPQGDIVSKTQFDLSVTTTVTSIPALARPGDNITINGTYLNWVKKVTFSRDKQVTTFVSQAYNQLVVKVPLDAETGTLMLRYLGTDSADVETADTLHVALPVATSFSPNPVKPLTNVTITGTNLDLAKKLIFNGFPTPITTFVSQSATQLVVQVPDKSKTGKLVMEAASGVQTTSSPDMNIVLPVITTFSPAQINLAANITITGTDLDLVKKVIFSGVAAPVTTFVNQSTTQLVVAVPAGSRDGKIKVEAASGVQTQSGGDLDVILPSVTSMAPNPVFPATPLTITGTRLNTVTSVTFENAPPVTSFTSQTATQIVLTVPNGVLRGNVTLGISSPADTVKSAAILEISGGVPPPTVAFPFYDDAVTANWNGWTGGGWGGTVDYNNASPVRAGAKSAKIAYAGGYGSPLQLGGAAVNMAPYTTFKVSIFGAPGSAGKQVKISFNGNNTPANGIPAGSANSISEYVITLGAEGQWNDYAIPRASFSGGSTTITLAELWIQEYSGSAGFTIYVDALGLN